MCGIRGVFLDFNNKNLKNGKSMPKGLPGKLTGQSVEGDGPSGAEVPARSRRGFSGRLIAVVGPL